MTQSTDQERAEFEAWKEDYALTFEPNYDEHLEADCRAAFLAGMQAARRSQVVPQGWKLVPEVADEKMQRAIAAQFNGTAREAIDAWSEALAATPQPPEAAPVQMPEPFTSLVRKKSWSPNCYEASPLSSAKDYGRQWADERINVYTEHQVRQILADHGIK